MKKTLFIILVITQVKAQTINTIVGDSTPGFNGDGILAKNAELHAPAGLTFDTNGNLYIADNNNSRIRKVDASEIITTIAGNGILGFSGDGGPANQASLNQPWATAFDALGNMYIADANNNRIRMVDPSGIIKTVAGSGATGIGHGNFSGDGGQATSAELN